MFLKLALAIFQSQATLRFLYLLSRDQEQSRVLSEIFNASI